MEHDIRVGERVMWAERDANGELLHQTLDGRDDMIVPAYGIVTAQPGGWHGDNTITRDDGSWAPHVQVNGSAAQRGEFLASRRIRRCVAGSVSTGDHRQPRRLGHPL